MKKLFYILPEYHKGTSSHFRYNVELLEALAEKRQVYLFIEKGEAPDVERIQKVRVGRFKLLPLRLLERFFVFSWARLRGYRQFYSHYGYLSALIAGFICRLSFGRLLFWHCEKRGNYEKKGCFLCHLPEKLMIDWPYRMILKLCSTLVTCTEKMSRYYQDTFNVPAGKIEVVGNWVDTTALLEAGKEVEKAEVPTVLFVHWLSPRKGTKILPELFDAIHQELPNARFLVAGDGPDFEWLTEEWEKRGLKNAVNMLGAVPNTDIAALYHQAHVLIHPSREEEFGRVLIEAMACGTPVVATETFGARSVLSPDQKKFLFDYDKPQDGAAHCVKLLKSPELQKAQSREGLERVKVYDKSRIIGRFLEVF